MLLQHTHWIGDLCHDGPDPHGAIAIAHAMYYLFSDASLSTPLACVLTALCLPAAGVGRGSCLLMFGSAVTFSEDWAAGSSDP